MTNIKHCPRCGRADILKECYFGSGIFTVCERCEWSFTIFDDGDADNHDIDRMLRDKQTRFERKSPRRGYEPIERTLARIGVRAMCDPEEGDRRHGRLAYMWPPKDSRGRDVV